MSANVTNQKVIEIYDIGVGNVIVSLHYWHWINNSDKIIAVP